MTIKPTSIYCACGAQWHGKYVVSGAPAIAAHQARWKAHDLRCWSVPHDWYRRRFKCLCAACVAERSQARREKRQKRQQDHA
jgi:hypothetical protein